MIVALDLPQDQLGKTIQVVSTPKREIDLSGVQAATTQRKTRPRQEERTTASGSPHGGHHGYPIYFSNFEHHDPFPLGNFFSKVGIPAILPVRPASLRFGSGPRLRCRSRDTVTSAYLGIAPIRIAGAPSALTRIVPIIGHEGGHIVQGILFSHIIGEAWSMESQGNVGRGMPGWEEKGRNGRRIFKEREGCGGDWKEVYLARGRWDAVGEDEMEGERCLLAAERGRRWLAGATSMERLGALEYGGGQYIHSSLMEEVMEVMKGSEALLFALEPIGEQMAHVIRVGGAPVVDCGTCRVSIMSRASSRAAEERAREGEGADRQLRQESAEVEEDVAGVAADKQLRQESMELDWPFSDLSSLSSLSRTPSTVMRSMIAAPPLPPRASTVERYTREGSEEEFADLDIGSSGWSLTPRQANVELVDLIIPALLNRDNRSIG
ncbi:hypothetical protein EV426DRAFT_707533 [Tirmania nivea]|nr:hypothetical protein EV426DRAFT_707533 [Tirmania nivea]